ncbi:MAG: YD repeat-containing protein [Nevskia sp.]|nr:YD repeat-containing protein [Nevskia sp.]MCK9384686.1 YD repeat-containing protein [Nevskia sp.]
MLLVGALILGLFNASNATDYGYDDNGRLVSVTNDAGETARYVYDSLGNIIRIERGSTQQIAISAISPNHGTPGT